MKKCSICKLEKEFSEFGKAARIKDGHRGQCKQCVNADSLRIYNLSHEKQKERGRNWYARNRESRAVTQKAWRESKKEELQIQARFLYALDPSRQKTAGKKWQQANPHKGREISARYRAAKLKRTPGWLTAEDHRTIELFYQMAMALSEYTGVPHEVDHDLPLQGKYVSGLHVPANLRVIPMSQNRAKKNTWRPE